MNPQTDPICRLISTNRLNYNSRVGLKGDIEGTNPIFRENIFFRFFKKKCTYNRNTTAHFFSEDSFLVKIRPIDTNRKKNIPKLHLSKDSGHQAVFLL